MELKDRRIKWSAAAVAIAALLIISIYIYIGGGEKPEGLYALGLHSMKSGSAARASEMFDEAFKGGYTLSASDDFEIVADAYRAVGRSRDVTRVYETVMPELSADADLVTKLGMSYVEQGMAGEAIEMLERALTLRSADASISFELGRLYEAKSDDEMARRHFTAFAASGAGTADDMLYAGRYLMKMGLYKNALAGFEAAKELLPSDDMRGYHAVNAAKNMLGWPTDEGMVITPGESIGNMRLRMSREEALDAWGEPMYQVDEGEYSVWGYGDGVSRDPVAVVFLDADSVIEIVTESTKHATSDGLSISNFRDPKYRDRFLRMRDENSSRSVFRYTLRGGGLAFYTGSPTSPESVRAVVYYGESPLTEHIGASWIYFMD